MMSQNSTLSFNTNCRITDCPLAVLTCCQQSHPFDERRIPLTSEPEKIGRSVAKLRAQVENGIFDCKVLSRNHALIWYEDGKFYLKDTKSSNGTFVNNQRLSKGSEESPPKEIFNCDIIQFGVDIMENKKITHGCIVAMVRLFHANGQEADSRSSLSQPMSNVAYAEAADNVAGTSIQELYQLQQYIKEAAHREQLLEAKLSTLLGLLESTQEASNNSWQALVDEDRLLSRIETLEAQLSLYSKNSSEDKLREEVIVLHAEREQFETAAKESLRAALQEKLEAVQKLADVERSLETTEEECSRLKTECAFAQSELDVLAQKHSRAMTELQELTTKYDNLERDCSALQFSFDLDKQEMQAKMIEMSKQESILNSRMQFLIADNDASKEQLAAMKIRVEQLTTAEATVNRNADISFSAENERLTDSDLEEQLRHAQVQLETYKAKLEASETELSLMTGQLAEVKDQLQKAIEDMAISGLRANELEEKLRESNAQINRMVESASDELRMQLFEAIRQKEISDQLCRRLEEEIVQKESILKGLRTSSGASNAASSRHISVATTYCGSPSVIHSSSSPNNLAMATTNHELLSASPTPTVNGRHHEHPLLSGSAGSSCGDTSSVVIGATAQSPLQIPCVPSAPVSPGLVSSGAGGGASANVGAAVSAPLQNGHLEDESPWPPDPCDFATLQYQYAKALQEKVMAETELMKYKAFTLQHSLQPSELCFLEELDFARRQHDSVQEFAVQSRPQALDMQKKLLSAEDKLKGLNADLRFEQQQRKQALAEVDSVKAQLADSQQLYQDSHSESEQLKVKLKALKEELEFERSLRTTSNLDNDNARIVLHRQAAKNQAEFAALKEECASLKNRIIAIEKEMKTSRKENCRLSTEYRHLQESYRELERLKDHVGEGFISKDLSDVSVASSSTSADAVSGQVRLAAADDEVVQLRRLHADQENEISHLRDRLGSDESSIASLERLQLQSQTVLICSFIPLLILFLAVVVAFLPFFSSITATAEHPEGASIQDPMSDSLNS